MTATTRPPSRVILASSVFAASVPGEIIVVRTEKPSGVSGSTTPGYMALLLHRPRDLVATARSRGVNRLERQGHRVFDHDDHASGTHGGNTHTGHDTPF